LLQFASVCRGSGCATTACRSRLAWVSRAREKRTVGPGISKRASLGHASASVPLRSRDDRAAVDLGPRFVACLRRSVAPFSNKAGGVKGLPVRAERSEPLTSSARLRGGNRTGAPLPRSHRPAGWEWQFPAPRISAAFRLRAPRGARPARSLARSMTASKGEKLGSLGGAWPSRCPFCRCLLVMLGKRSPERLRRPRASLHTEREGVSN